MTESRKISDLKLWHKIKNGNKPAFKDLFEKYYMNLCEYSFMYVLKNEIAEEVVADVFANIWLKRNKIDVNKSLESYLYISTKNRSITYLRKKNIKFVQFDDKEFQNIKSNTTPEDILISKEDVFHIHNMIDAIPLKSKQVFIMHRFHGLKYSEIALINKISVKTVEKHISVSLKILRSQFEKFNVKT